MPAKRTSQEPSGSAAGGRVGCHPARRALRPAPPAKAPLQPPPAKAPLQPPPARAPRGAACSEPAAEAEVEVPRRSSSPLPLSRGMAPSPAISSTGGPGVVPAEPRLSESRDPDRTHGSRPHAEELLPRSRQLAAAVGASAGEPAVAWQAGRRAAGPARNSPEAASEAGSPMRLAVVLASSEPAVALCPAAGTAAAPAAAARPAPAAAAPAEAAAAASPRAHPGSKPRG